MSERKRAKKRKSDSDGVKVKRSYYSFSKYYPGGGSSQKYRKVMVETKDEKRKIKIVLGVFGLLVLVIIGYFSTTVAIDISNAPTTTKAEVVTTVPVTENNSESVPDETTKPTEPEKSTFAVTQEEPEREVNVTTQPAQTEE